MKVNVQTINKVVFTVSVPDNATLADLKEEVLKTNQYKIQKGVFKGVVLSDTDVLVEKGIVENEKLVIIGNKALNIPPPVAAEKKEETPAPAAAPEAAPAPSPAPVQSETAASAADAFVTGDEMEETINTIMAAHDFPREKVVKALRAAYFNPDRAFEFLITDSIPEVPEEPTPAAAEGGAPTAPPSQATGAPPAGGTIAPAFNIPGVGTVTAEQTAEIMAILARGNSGASPPDPQALGQFLAQLSRLNQVMEAGGAGGSAGTPTGAPAGQGGAPSAGSSALRQALSEISEFPEICRQIRENPAALSSMLEALRGSSPQLFHLITANQEEFLQIIQQSGEGGAPGAGTPPPGAIVISVADREAINRLMQLGFSEQAAAQAYLVSDRDEETAANLLCQGMGD